MEKMNKIKITELRKELKNLKKKGKNIKKYNKQIEEIKELKKITSKNRVISFKLSLIEEKDLKKKAIKHKMTLSEYIRSILLK